MEEPRGRYSRGYLPHIEAGPVRQFITWRLADAIRVDLLHQWKQELSRLPEAESKKEFYRRIEAHLDEGFGSKLLQNPVAASAVQNALIFGHGERYTLSAWCIMPTHVHCLLKPNEGWTMAKIMHSIKSFSAHEINKSLGRTGHLWQDESYDRIIRNDEHAHRIASYIEWNPVKAKLCADPKDWPYSSANPHAKEKLVQK